MSVFKVREGLSLLSLLFYSFKQSTENFMKKDVLLTCKEVTLHITKLAVFMLIFLGLLTTFKASAGTGRQDVSAKKISIALKDVSLRNALIKISDLADVSFVYVNSEALNKSKVSITAHNEQVGVLLKKLLTPYSFTYTVVDDRIIIRHDTDKTGRPETAKTMPDMEVLIEWYYDLIVHLLTE